MVGSFPCCLPNHPLATPPPPPKHHHHHTQPPLAHPHLGPGRNNPSANPTHPHSSHSHPTPPHTPRPPPPPQVPATGQDAIYATCRIGAGGIGQVLLELKFVAGAGGVDVSVKAQRQDVSQLVFDGLPAVLLGTA